MRNKFAHIDKQKIEEQVELWRHLTDSIPEQLRQQEPVVVEPVTLGVSWDTAKKRGQTLGLQTGIGTIDDTRFLGGLHKGSLYVIGGNTGVGKTDFVCNLLLRTVLRTGAKTLFLTTEMPHWEVSRRLWSLWQSQPVVDEGVFREFPVEYVDNHAAITVTLIRDLLASHNYELLMIDNLQWFCRGGQDTAQSTGMATQAIKQMAIEFDIPIVLVSHLSRTGYQDHLPDLGNLKGSSYIEQDADAVLLLARNYESDPGDKNNDGIMYPADLTRVHCRKNRLTGKLFNVFLRPDENMYLQEDPTWYANG